MNQLPHHVMEVTMNTATVVGKSSNRKENKKYNTNQYMMKSDTTIPPPINMTNDDTSQMLSSSSSSWDQQRLSSSPTDVILSSQSSMSSMIFQPRPWPIFSMSNKAQRTHNPIRAILDPIVQSSSKNQSGKTQISLALGDPIAASSTTTTTTTGSSDTVASTTATTPLLRPCPHAIQAVLDTLQTDDTSAAASYCPAIGTYIGRQAIATHHSHPPYYTYNPDTDIIIANGCSGALELVLTSLLVDHNKTNDTSITTTSILLVPSPGFPLYRVIAESIGATVISYPLLPQQQWQIDLLQLRNIIEQYQHPWSDDDETSNIPTTTIRGIVINNPSNPTGAVYTTTHLQQIVQLCQEYYIPIIADEIYGDLIFPQTLDRNDDDDNIAATTTDTIATTESHNYVSIAKIAAQMGRFVPVVTASGIGKQFLVPGWRIGWICFQDNIYGSLQHVKDGAKRLAQIVLGASHLAQVAIPALLLTPPNEETDNQYRNSYVELKAWKHSVRRTLYEQSKILCVALQQIGPCLEVIIPQGAMYAMVRIHLEYFNHSTIRNDIDFTKLLYQEENVVVLPGTCFKFPNSFRVVFCAPIPILKEGAQRIYQFCHRHLK